MRAARPLSSLAAALITHAAVAIVVSFARTPNASSSLAPVARDELLLLDDERPAEQPHAQDHADVESLSARATPMTGLRAARPYRPPVRSADGDVQLGVHTAPNAPPRENDLTTPRARPIDLGIGTYWKGVAMGAASQPQATDDANAPAPPRSTDRILRDQLDAHDRSVGLGSAGPLVSAAHAAAAASLAPDVGVATLDVECDGKGEVVDVHVVAANADASAWNGVARELFHRMSATRLRVPAGARGVRVRVRIAAERALPSGDMGETNLGAVPDDAPGGNRVCEGKGIQRRCIAGFPIGITKSGSDVVNANARASRVVRVQIVDETTLGEH